LGSLIFLHKAIVLARLFVNRVIALLKIAPESGFIYIGNDFKRDLQWFGRFVQTYNGITRFDNFANCIDYDLYTDASFKGLGAYFNSNVYAYEIEVDNGNIAFWEALNVLEALWTWADCFKHRTVHVFCDNSAAVAILQTSRGADTVLQAIARNVWLLSAMWDIRLIFEHIPVKDNKIADLLSR
jgi:hypothetical protein